MDFELASKHKREIDQRRKEANIAISIIVVYCYVYYCCYVLLLLLLLVCVYYLYYYYVFTSERSTSAGRRPGASWKAGMKRDNE